MAKDRERAINPAAAQRKAEKQKALKKGKAALQAQRNERLAHRNPDRLQRQIDDLKSLEAGSGKLSPRDKKQLEDLERDVARVRKAKEALGNKGGDESKSYGDRGTQQRGRGGHGQGGGAGGRGGVLGKRSRDIYRGGSGDDGSETDESVRGIPMPRDTPPPFPAQRHRTRERESAGRAGAGSNANAVPLGEGVGGGGERVPHALPQRPEAKVQAQTVYESKAQVRDLRKEAVERFVPNVVQRKLGVKKGDHEAGRAVEPKEAVDDPQSAGVASKRGKGDGAVPGGLEEEEKRFERELRSVQMEEVADEEI